MKEILSALAPCGLDCKRCVRFENGEVKKTSLKLKELLKNFDERAKKFKNFMPIFAKYPDFEEILNLFLEANCKGCRSGACGMPNCGVFKCYNEKKMDFCADCNEFPCNKTNFNPELHTKWLEINKAIQKLGIENYYKESLKKPRY